MGPPNPLVSRTAKHLSAAGAVLGSLVGWFLTVVLVGSLVEERTMYHNGKPVWIGGVILAYFSFALSWFAFRLIRQPLPTEGGTMMPRWFLVMTIALFVGCIVIVLIGSLLQHTT